MATVERVGPVEVFLGLDVGKRQHYGCALDPSGTVLWEGPVGNDEVELRAMVQRLRRHGRVLLVVDQVAAIGTLAVRVAAATEVPVGYLPGLAMRRIADLHPGQAKTDRKDAWVIADAGRSLPHTVVLVNPDDPELVAEIGVLAGYSQDLGKSINQETNRLHDAVTHVHPALERLLKDHFDRNGVLAVLAAAPTPAALQALGVEGIAATMKAGGSPRLAKTLPTQIVAVLSEQSLVLPGTAAFATVIAGTAARLLALLRDDQALERQLADLLAAHPLGRVLTSMPYVGVRTAAAVLAAAPNVEAFPDADHFVAYAGLNPVTRQSGSSIRGERPNRGGHRQLRNALWRSADMARVGHPASRDFYNRKRDQHKKHGAAVMALARRRARVMFALMRDQVEYQEPARAA